MIRSLLVAAFLLIGAAGPAGAVEVSASAEAVGRPNFPPLTGRVVDQAGILPSDTAEKLTAELAAHEQRTGQQVVVAVVKSLGGRPIEDYGYQLGRFWGIGQKDKNTGAILLVAPADHKVRIEVGYGLEGQLTDAISSTIINQTILPRFKAGDMAGGISAGTEQMLVALGDNIAAAEASPPPRPGQSQGPAADLPTWLTISIALIFQTLFVGAIVLSLVRRSHSGAGSAALIGTSNWSSGSSSSDSGFSGGGGSFGGGGASGSW